MKGGGITMAETTIQQILDYYKEYQENGKN